MIRQQLLTPNHDRAGFRWRGTEVSRVEGFSDAVFAFAVTLLVVSLEVPKTFTELLTTMRSFIPFGVSFLMLMQIWHWHYEYFGRYGLRDHPRTWLNAGLLFVVLFYVYPMKFLFTILSDQLLGIDPSAVAPAGGQAPILAESQTTLLMLMYGAGYIAVHTVFAVLYIHAYRRGTPLGLSELELLDTRAGVERFRVASHGRRAVAGCGVFTAAVGLRLGWLGVPAHRTRALVVRCAYRRSSAGRRQPYWPDNALVVVAACYVGLRAICQPHAELTCR